MQSQTSKLIMNAARIAATKGVLVVTDADLDDSRIAAASAAADVASRSKVPVTLYDRSEETWGDSQHPEGPLALGDERLTGRDELRSQMQHVADNGAEVQGWVASLPSISAAMTAIAEIGADIVFVPESMNPKLFERALQGDSLAETLSNQLAGNSELDATVFEVSAAGSIAQAAEPETR